MTPIEHLLSFEPYELSCEQKKIHFSAAIKEALEHHINTNPFFKSFSESQGFSIGDELTDISNIPYLPVNLFKNRNLMSVPQEQIKATLNSSATSGTPSSVNIDVITSKRQARASAKVMSSFLGNYRRPFLILDEKPGRLASAEMSARSAATLGFLVLASSAEYVLQTTEDKQLHLDIETFKSKLLPFINKGEEICVFGFTFILYHHVIRALKEKNEVFKLPPNSKVVHIGGWKKLESQKVDKKTFLDDIEAVLGVPSQNVIDFYGFTEQMGLVYPNIGLEPKITSAYSEIIIRDFQSLEPVPDGKEGLIQIITPIPHSYPGTSILTEDVGRIISRDKSVNGRNGVHFEVLGRAKEAEVRGCGDIMAEYVN
jgi:hypothetical protein